MLCRFAGCNLWTGREQDRAQAICQFCDTDFVGTDGTLGGKCETTTSPATGRPSPIHRLHPRKSMFRTLLKPRIHRVAVTQCKLHCEGYCAINEDLPHDASIAENEQIHIWNIHNGERLVTNATTGQCGSGIVSANGPAAHCACAGDLIVIVAFAQVHEDQAATHPPQLVFVDDHNRQTELRHAVPTQAHPRRLTIQPTRDALVARTQASV